MATINLPNFWIAYEDIYNLRPPNNREKPKLLIKVRFPDLNNPADMQLLAYATNTHDHYAQNRVPESFIHKYPTRVTAVDSDLTIGNNDLTIKRLLKKTTGNRVWNYMRLVPVSRKCFPTDPRNHLAFKIEFLNEVDEDLTAEADPVISNPSPPAPPSDETLQP